MERDKSGDSNGKKSAPSDVTSEYLLQPKISEVSRSAVDSSLPGPQRAEAAAANVLPDLVPALAVLGLHVGDEVFLRAFKREGLLELWMRGNPELAFQLFRTYHVEALSGVPGPKLAEGDRQVPEGFYSVARSDLKPDSRFHLAMNLGFPNSFDRAHGRTGSYIMIHGADRSIGCLAMGNPAIEEIFTLSAAALDAGQPAIQVHLFPFVMTREAIASSSHDPAIRAFWNQLALGFESFERTRVPPQVDVIGMEYRIHPGR